MQTSQTSPVETQQQTQHCSQTGNTISGCKRQESDRRADDRNSVSQHPKHVKLNCGASATHSGRSTKTNNQTPDYSVSMQVLPRKQSIGLYSGETKALFCISLFGQKRSPPDKLGERSEQGYVQKRTIVLKIKSSSPIRKVLHPKSARKGDRNATVLIDNFVFDGESRDVIVQVADLSHDISLQVSARVVQASGRPTVAIVPSKVIRSIERPATNTVAEDNTYVLAQLLRYAATRVLDHELSASSRSQALCAVVEKSRVKEVLGMIRRSPAVVKSLPMVQALQQKLESMEYDSWSLV